MTIRSAGFPPRTSATRLAVSALLVVSLGWVGADTGMLGVLAAQTTYEEVGGTFADGTRYLMRVPSNWNGVLLRDLDFASGAERDRNRLLLERGYALSGTARHERRFIGNYDPAREIRYLNMVLDLFERRFGAPDRVIHWGCSGGGNVGLAIAEDFADRVDGVIAMGALIPTWMQNTYLDYWFAAKALLAPNLQIVDLPDEPGTWAASRPYYPELTAAWRRTINAAQKTPEGRARIALITTVGQIADWVNPREPNPSRDDVSALQYSMYQTLLEHAVHPGGTWRYMFETAPGVEFGPGSYQLSWNTGVDYRQYFENGNERLKAAVRQLYEDAGLDLGADLDRINAFPRVEADEKAVEYWRRPGRRSDGAPQVPIIRLHEIGDWLVPLSGVQGYKDLVRANGKEDMLRVAIVEAATHCDFTPGETAAMVESMMRRLDTGHWEDFDPGSLSELARSLDPSSTPRFIAYDGYMPRKYNRAWVPQRVSVPE